MRYKKTMSGKFTAVLLVILAVAAIISVFLFLKSFDDNKEKNGVTNDATSEITSDVTDETAETSESTPDTTSDNSSTSNNSKDKQNDKQNNKPNSNTPDNNISSKDNRKPSSDYANSEIAKYLTADELKEAINDPFLRLINLDNLLSSSYTPSTKNAYGIPLDTRITANFSAMMSAARKAGHTDLAANSGYRSHKKQTELYNRKINLFKSKGYNAKEAERRAGEIVAKPGSSEHQYGMSADICNRAITSKYGNLNEAFAKTSTYKWLIENSAKYGFVLRYPEDKYSITKIVYEPWHYRYVGKKHAKIMNEKNFCLEEYTEYLRKNYNKYFK